MSSSIYYGTRPHRCNNAPKIKNWCQNGVKSRKSDDYKEEKVLQTPQNQGLQKNLKKLALTS